MGVLDWFRQESPEQRRNGFRVVENSNSDVLLVRKSFEGDDGLGVYFDDVQFIVSRFHYFLSMPKNADRRNWLEAQAVLKFKRGVRLDDIEALSENPRAHQNFTAEFMLDMLWAFNDLKDHALAEIVVLNIKKNGLQGSEKNVVEKYIQILRALSE